MRKISSIGRGEGGGGGGGTNIPFALPPPSPNNPPILSFNVYVKQYKLDHKRTNLILVYVPFILFEGICKSILFNSILNFAISSAFNVRNVTIWH